MGIVGRLKSWVGSLIKVAAYNIQAYPIVAVAPIIFILLGDGLITRLADCGHDLLFSPVAFRYRHIYPNRLTDIEHFYVATRRMNWRLEVRIRAYENINKLTTVMAGSATMAMVGTIVAEFIAADAGIGYSIRIALYQSDLSKDSGGAFSDWGMHLIVFSVIGMDWP